MAGAAWFSEGNAATVLFFTAYALALLAAWLIVARRKFIGSASLATASAAVTMLGCYCLIIMRHPIVIRVPDLASLFAIVGGWTLAQVIHVVRRQHGEERSAGQIAVALAVAAGYMVAVASVLEVARVDGEFEKTRVADGLPKVWERLTSLKSAGSDWPWSWYWPGGDYPDVVKYLNQCTDEEDDRVADVVGAGPLTSPDAGSAPDRR